MVIYLDFDGTVVEHAYPEIGRVNFGCMEVIKKLQTAGHQIILNTYRVECNNYSLREAIDFFEDSYRYFKNIDNLDSIKITEHTFEKFNPPTWNVKYAIENNKPIYIDDIAHNIPLKKSVMVNGFMVDWDCIEKELIEYNLIKN